VSRPAQSLGPARLLTRDQAELLVPRRAFTPVRSFLVNSQETLSAALEMRLWGYGFTKLAENLDNFGRFFLRSDAPAPQLWYGIAWGIDDAPGTLPSWGASLQLEGEWIRDWRRGAGGLRAAMNCAARDSDEQLGVYEFEETVELAQWRSMDDLLEAENQERYLVEQWAGFLDMLARAEIAEATDAFIADAFGL
jgi:hypothetical protein